MKPFTVFRSQYDPDKILVVATVTVNGVDTILEYEIEDTDAALDDLVDKLFPAAPPNIISLIGCKRCPRCGRYKVGFDSPDIAHAKPPR